MKYDALYLGPCTTAQVFSVLCLVTLAKVGAKLRMLGFAWIKGVVRTKIMLELDLQKL